jgi:MoxR-like ATPase
MADRPTFQRFIGDGKHGRGGRTSALREDRGNYLAPPALATAVNTALAVARPLLITGEPGCGKTSLAYAIADELGLGDVLTYVVRSDSVARDVLYAFDHLRRLYDVQAQVPTARDPVNYRTLRALGEAIDSEVQRVVLIDEIDKAPRDLPNDLLTVIDELDYEIPETGEHKQHGVRPIVVITSNDEHPLPDAFLRRCVYHHIDFPDDKALQQIVAERLGAKDRDHDAPSPPTVADKLYETAVARFVALRRDHSTELAKQPSTAELIDWVRVLVHFGVPPDRIKTGPLAELYPGALLKTREDLRRLTR